MRNILDSTHGGPQDWGSQYGNYCVRVHGNITSSRVWVHGMVIHLSW